MDDWYDIIEPKIRPTVKLLRNNGFNTICSCEHEMYVQCDILIDGEMKRLDDLLFNHNYRDYKIIFQIERIDGHSYSFLQVDF